MPPAAARKATKNNQLARRPSGPVTRASEQDGFKSKAWRDGVMAFYFMGTAGRRRSDAWKAPIGGHLQAVADSGAHQRHDDAILALDGAGALQVGHQPIGEGAWREL